MLSRPFSEEVLAVYKRVMRIAIFIFFVVLVADSFFAAFVAMLAYQSSVSPSHKDPVRSS